MNKSTDKIATIYNDNELSIAISTLTQSQREWVIAVIRQFQLTTSFWRNTHSELVTDTVLNRLGDALRIHHAFSRQPLSKDRFEFAFERALKLGNFDVKLAASRTNRGHDMTINGIPVNLKTEAAANIKKDMLHISKFMELGRGEWTLPALLRLFLEHMRNYERIFQFRCLEPGPHHFCYELVEIPKILLQEAANAVLEVQEDSRQNPKPGYGRVYDENAQMKFALYFDGGTERKLQIKNIRKNLCIIHATWCFESTPLE